MLPTSKLKPAIKAPALKQCDKLALLCAGSRPANPAVLTRCSSIVEDMGFKPVVGENVMNVSGFMAGTDAERLSDLNQALNDESIAGIFFITGGYGALHLLPTVDFDVIAKQPKVFLGCDDNTVLLNAIQARTGLVTFHGPNVDQIKTKRLFDLVKKAVTSREPLAELQANAKEPGEVYGRDFYCAFEGTVTGRLVGGNLTAFASLLGTPYEPVMREAILLLEDINEQNGILDRWFTSLYLAGHLQSIEGVACGSFENCSPRGSVNMLSVMETFSDRLKYLRTPGCFGLPFGQNSTTSVAPLGINATLNCAEGRLEFLDAALQ